MRPAEKQRRIATTHQEDIAWFTTNPKHTVRIRRYVQGEFITHLPNCEKTMVVKTPDGGILRRPIDPSRPNATKVLYNHITGSVDALWFVDPSTVDPDSYILADK